MKRFRWGRSRKSIWKPSNWWHSGGSIGGSDKIAPQYLKTIELNASHIPLLSIIEKMNPKGVSHEGVIDNSNADYILGKPVADHLRKLGEL